MSMSTFFRPRFPFLRFELWGAGGAGFMALITARAGCSAEVRGTDVGGRGGGSAGPAGVVLRAELALAAAGTFPFTAVAAAADVRSLPFALLGSGMTSLLTAFLGSGMTLLLTAVLACGMTFLLATFLWAALTS